MTQLTDEYLEAVKRCGECAGCKLFTMIQKHLEEHVDPKYGPPYQEAARIYQIELQRLRDYPPRSEAEDDSKREQLDMLYRDAQRAKQTWQNVRDHWIRNSAQAVTCDRPTIIVRHG